MASGLFFDPQVLLRAAPLISSSFSLWYCVDQYMFFNNFIVPSNRAKGSAILPGYWKTFLAPGLAFIFGLYTVSAAGAIANLYQGSTASFYYKLGLAFTLGHFTFVPVISPKIWAIRDDRSKGQSWKDQQSWLRIHAIRSMFVDLPGWLCYLAAVMASVRAIE